MPLQVLLEIHSLGVLHGDVRAENVLIVQQEGGWKVGHWAVARPILLCKASSLLGRCLAVGN